MYNAKYIIPGLVVFFVLFSSPFWANKVFGDGGYKQPELALPKGEKECIENTDLMRAEHMQILDTWRDMAIRHGDRVYVATNGKKYVISLQNTCMKCHSNKKEFCDKCHDANSVEPYCWSCHLEPRGNN